MSHQVVFPSETSSSATKGISTPRMLAIETHTLTAVFSLMTNEVLVKRESELPRCARRMKAFVWLNVVLSVST